MAVFWDVALCNLVDIDHWALDDGGSKVFSNTGQYLPDYPAQLD
jgi:hypothetical protein